MFSSNQAETWEQVLVGRGMFAGVELLLEHWQTAQKEYIASHKKEEEFDEHNPLPEY